MIISLLQGRLQKGIETILEFNHYDEIIKDVDLVITGEGKLDHQSFQGKVIDGILQHNHHVATIAIVGKNMCDETFYKSKGLLDVYETNETNQPMEIVKETCQEDLRKTIHKIKYPY